MHHWTIRNGFISCSMSHLESRDPDLFKDGIDRYKKAILSDECPIWNLESQTSSNVALNTEKMANFVDNAILYSGRLRFPMMGH